MCALASIQACEYNNEEDLFAGAPVCTDSGFTFQASVKPILQSRCYICHAAGSYVANGAEHNLEDFAVLQGLALSGKLVKAVTHAPGVAAMPKNAEKLDDCKISQIRKWVEAGAPNN